MTCKCNQYSEVYLAGIGMIQLREEGKRVPEHEYSRTFPCYCKACTNCLEHMPNDSKIRFIYNFYNFINPEGYNLSWIELDYSHSPIMGTCRNISDTWSIGVNFSCS